MSFLGMINLAVAISFFVSHLMTGPENDLGVAVVCVLLAIYWQTVKNGED
jgi:hypothetical protein